MFANLNVYLELQSAVNESLGIFLLPAQSYKFNSQRSFLANLYYTTKYINVYLSFDPKINLQKKAAGRSGNSA